MVNLKSLFTVGGHGACSKIIFPCMSNKNKTLLNYVDEF
jgi:hypothetical protein